MRKRKLSARRFLNDKLPGNLEGVFKFVIETHLRSLVVIALVII